MREFDKATILLFIILLVLLTTSIFVYVNKILTPTINNNKVIEEYEKNKKAELNTDETEVEEVKEETEEEKILNLKSMTEMERIQQYFVEYINYVDQNEYEKAYACLYDEFKQNYFSTQESYETYVNETYPDYIGIEYTNISRQGTYYILTVYIYNSLDTEVTNYLEQKFVIYEIDFGEFYLSFQV